jgi:hypothetical protein
MMLLYLGTAFWLGGFAITIGRLAYDEWRIEREKDRATGRGSAPGEFEVAPAPMRALMSFNGRSSP